jgi:transposase
MKQQNALLQLQLLQLQKIVFGSRHEKFKTDPNAHALQSALFNEEKIAEVLVESTRQVAGYEKKKTVVQINHPGRYPLPEGLRRVDILLMPHEDVSGLQKIGEEITEILEYQPGELFAKRYVRPEFLKPSTDGLNHERVIAALPSQPIPKSYVSASLLAYLLVSKFVDHLPVYRQIEIFKRQKVSIPDSTVVNWIEAGYKLLEPLYELYKKKILSSRYLQADETYIKVLDKTKSGTTHRGFYWVYYDGVQRNALYTYAPGRDALWPKETLQKFEGYLQVDGYDGYHQFKSNPNISVLHCWAHVRRKFFEVKGMDEDKAQWMLTEIQKLYAIEHYCSINNMQPDEKIDYRKEHAQPVLTAIHDALKKYQQEVLPSSPIGKAVNYALNLWKGLETYLQDAKLHIDNNLIENSIRPVALGRKNYLFAGSHQGAERSAMFYSFFAACKTHKIEPVEWLTTVLSVINDTKLSNLHQLLPQNYGNIEN